ncbi:MAG: hypothetical protein AAB482_00105 [Patescibacteria group bacterium]
MIIVLTGLHGCGKSHLSRIFETYFEWTHVNKRHILEELFGKSFSSPESIESIQWYRNIYRTVGSSELMAMVLAKIVSVPKIVLDAVHNPLEWDVIKSSGRRAILTGVFTPQIVRNARNSPLDRVLDIKRTHYWHASFDESFRCLMSEIEWAFTGTNNDELQVQECAALISHLTNNSGSLCT